MNKDKETLTAISNGKDKDKQKIPMVQIILLTILVFVVMFFGLVAEAPVYHMRWQALKTFFGGN